MIEAERNELVAAIKDDWELARRRARQLLEEGDRSYWPKAVHFFAQVHGKIQPSRVHVEHGGRVEVDHRHYVELISDPVAREHAFALLERVEGVRVRDVAALPESAEEVV